MGLFLRFLVELARGNGEPVLSGDAAVRFMNDPAEAPGWGEGARYGNGIAHVEVDGRRFLQHTGGMVSFCSSLHVDVEAGVAAFASSNVHWAFGYRPRDVTLRACELLRAAHGSAPTPAAEPATVDEPQRFLGEFNSRIGDRFEIVSSRKGVAMRRAGGTTVMQPIGDTAFACEDESFRLSGLVFEVKDRLATRAWSGDVEYLRKPEEGFHSAVSSELMAMTGRYDTDDRGGTPIRVFARQGKLWLHRVNYICELTKLDNGDWRLGEEDW